MRVRGFVAIAVLAVLVSMVNLNAQDKGKAAPQKENIQGTIQNISKDTSTFTVRTTGTTTRLIVYNPKTRFMYGHSDNNKPGALADVKVTNYISCAGTFDAKGQLMATECVYRETR